MLADTKMSGPATSRASRTPEVKMSASRSSRPWAVSLMRLAP